MSADNTDRVPTKLAPTYAAVVSLTHGFRDRPHAKKKYLSSQGRLERSGSIRWFKSS